MIDYSPFWDTLKSKGISSYALINKYKISNGTVGRLRQGKPISTTTIDQLCSALQCKVEDIILFVENEKQ